MDNGLDHLFNTKFTILKHTTLNLKKQRKKLGLALLFRKQNFDVSEYKKIILRKPPIKFIFRQYLKLVVNDDQSLNRLIKAYELTHKLTKEKLLIINTHLYWEGDSSYLKSQLLQILDNVSNYKHKIILCGDLNTTSKSKRNLLKQTMNSYNFLESKKNRSGTFQYFSNFNLPKDPFNKPKKLLSKVFPLNKLGTKEFDYIFYKNFEYRLDTTVYKIKGSDHFPLSVDLDQSILNQSNI